TSSSRSRSPPSSRLWRRSTNTGRSARSFSGPGMEEQLSILIIDDDMLDRMAIRRALRAAGLAGDVAEAESSAAAVALLAGGSFDCILLDYLLPPTDGLAVLRELRADGVTVPIVVLTGQGDERV